MNMADALEYLRYKFDLDMDARSPIEIPNANRATLARLFMLLEFKTGVEVGVERGLYSEVLCKQNPGVKLFCVDSWKAYRGYKDHVDQAKLDRFYEEATQRLALYQRTTLIRKWSVEAAKDFDNSSLDFVYLDGNHSIEHVIADLAAWSPKVRPGGVISGHDYSRYNWPNQIHVVPAIHAWVDAYEIKPWFLLGTQAKVDGQLRDDSRSWFWVQREPRHRKSGPKVHQ